MLHTRLDNDEIARRGQELYRTQIAPQVETEENIGKIVVIDVETGDYEVDTACMPVNDCASATLTPLYLVCA